MDIAVPIGLIGLTWLALIIALTGIGLLGWRAMRGERLTGETVVRSAWLGLALVILLLQILHFWLPLGGGVSFAVICALGLAGIVAHVRQLVRWCSDSVKRHYVAWSLLAPLLAWTAHRAAGPCFCPDTALYHVNAVKWSAQHPIIIGIANLHERLAFNNSNFLFGGMLEFGYWKNRSHNLANGLLVAMLMITSVTAISHGWERKQRLRPDHVFGAVLLTAAVAFAIHNQAFNISSHSSNLASAATVMTALYMVLAEILRSRSTWGTRQSQFAVLSATALLSASVTIKLSTALTCGSAWVILVTIWWRRTRKAGAPTALPLATFAVTSALLIGPWLARSVLLSGYPAFPNPAFKLDVDWAYPTNRAKYINELITSWAQSKARPGEINDWRWIGPWWRGLWSQYNRYEAVVSPLWIAAGGAVVMLLRIRRVWRYRSYAAQTLWLLPPIITGMVFWFLTAPDPRFAAYLFFALAATVIAIALGTSARSRRSIGKRISLMVCVLLALAPVYCRAMANHLESQLTFAQNLVNVIVYRPGPDRGFYDLPQPLLERRFTGSGLEVYVIKPGGAIWDGPLVSTPKSRYTPRLQLRDREAGVRGGFNLAPE